jgi:hypothetical protein
VVPTLLLLLLLTPLMLLYELLWIVQVTLEETKEKSVLKMVYRKLSKKMVYQHYRKTLNLQ